MLGALLVFLVVEVEFAGFVFFGAEDWQNKNAEIKIVNRTKRNRFFIITSIVIFFQLLCCKAADFTLTLNAGTSFVSNVFGYLASSARSFVPNGSFAPILYSIDFPS